MRWIAVCLCILLVVGCQEQPGVELSSTPTVVEESPTSHESPVVEATPTPAETVAADPTPFRPPVGRPPAANPFARGKDPARPKSSKDASVDLVALSDDEDKQETRDYFGPDTEEIFLRVKTHHVEPGQVLRTTWFPTANPKAKMLDSASTSEENPTFSVRRPKNGWFDGEYTIYVEVGGEILGATTFTIVGHTSSENPLDYARLTTSLQDQKPQRSFATDTSSILLVVGTSRVREGTPVRAVWRADKVTDFEPEEVVSTVTVDSGGAKDDCLFTFAPPTGGYHPGQYSVELFVDRQAAQKINFSIE
ncbi:MAG: hypothetical protein KC910_04105 [Candidatus Eremiobacteraeota bacterium]|nr:hypothetical protein [Candidatus Eremiobacteraeota bacterium]